MQRWVASGMALSIAIGSGCSFALVQGPKPAPAAESDCTTSRLAPILDSVFTAVMLITVVQSLATSDADWQKQLCDANDPNCSPAISQGGAALIFSPLALLGAAGMYYGYTRTSECRNAQPRVEEAPQSVPMTVPPPVGAPPVSAPVAPVPQVEPPVPVAAPAPVPAATPTPTTPPTTTAVPANPYGASKPAPAPVKVKPKPTPKLKADPPPAPPVGIPLPGGP